MTQAKLRAATLGGSADDIENAFYEALHTADIQKLMGCWADEELLLLIFSEVKSKRVFLGHMAFAHRLLLQQQLL